MEIAIFDDEKIYCSQISNLIEEFFMNEYPNIDFDIHTFTRENDLEHFIRRTAPQIVFLDITTTKNENYGLDIAKYIREKNDQAHIIFVTSCIGKVIDALDGLIRPSQFFEKPVCRQKMFGLLSSIIDSTMNSKDYIAVKFGRSDCLINIHEIYYIQKVDRKTQISMINRSVEVRNALSKVCENLPGFFLNIDKGIVINIKMVRDVDYRNGYVTLKNGFRAEVARRSKKNLKEAFDAYKEAVGLCSI